MSTVYVIDKQTGQVIDWRTTDTATAGKLAALWRVTRSQYRIEIQHAAPQELPAFI